MIVFGDDRGGHVKVFQYDNPMSGVSYDAYYFGGAGLGICMDAIGRGSTPDQAFSILWRKLHNPIRGVDN